MLDTKGPEIRSGFFANGASKITLVKGETSECVTAVLVLLVGWVEMMWRHIQHGSPFCISFPWLTSLARFLTDPHIHTVILTSDYSYLGDARKLACSYATLAPSVTPGQSILVADGSLVLTVLSTDVAAGEVACRIENNCAIGERKNMNLPGVVVDLPTLTDKDIDDIQNWGVKYQVDFIAASFVRKASDVVNIRQVLGEAGKGIKIICKIENQEGMENYDAILKETDAIMVAR